MDDTSRTDVAPQSGAERSDASVLDDMAVIGDHLEALRAVVNESDPSGGVERMMHCSWFGELTLAFPQVRAIRVALAPPDDKASLAGNNVIALCTAVVYDCRLVSMLRLSFLFRRFSYYTLSAMKD